MRQQGGRGAQRQRAVSPSPPVRPRELQWSAPPRTCATSGDTFSTSQARIAACVSCACSGVALSPVPIAQTYEPKQWRRRHSGGSGGGCCRGVLKRALRNGACSCIGGCCPQHRRCSYPRRSPASPRTCPKKKRPCSCVQCHTLGGLASCPTYGLIRDDDAAPVLLGHREDGHHFR